ncbi:MAG: hypothetical protein LBL33_00960 [Tannerella sp.]|nr:hypothetical protein [Tannerella sp.]
MNKLLNAQLNLLADRIIQKSEFCPNEGLLDGKMGICIFLYHYARFFGNDTIISLADDLVDSVYEQVFKNKSLKFENGITGIAWGLHHLTHNNFVEADLNDVLFEVDKRFMKKVEQHETILNDEWFGAGLYVLLRLTPDSKEIWEETVKLLISQLKRQFVFSRYMDFCIKVFKCKTISIIILFLAKIYKYNICRSEIEAICSNLDQSLVISHETEKNSADKKLFEYITKEAEKTIPTFSIPNKIKITTFQQITMLDLNTCYLNKLFFPDFGTDKTILSDKTAQIISDTHLIPGLLSFFRSGNMGLCSHITGLAWTLLQMAIIKKAN